MRASGAQLPCSNSPLYPAMSCHVAGRPSSAQPASTGKHDDVRPGLSKFDEIIKDAVIHQDLQTISVLI